MELLTVAKARAVSEPGRYRADPTLYLNVALGGSKSWIQRIAIDGRRHDIGLGPFPVNRWLAMLPNLALVTAISKSTLRRDANGNPGLDRSTSRGRIDLLSATVIAAGLAAPAFDRPQRRRLRSAPRGD